MAVHGNRNRAVPARSGRRSARRVAGVLLTASAIVLAGTGVAAAYFTSAGTGTGTASTGTLAPPTGVGGVQAPGTGNVSVSWTAPTGTPAASGYYVLRTDSANATAPACGTSAASPVANTSCVDTAVPLGAYMYTVVAMYRSWTSTSVPSREVDVVAAPQTITFTSAPTSPTFGGTYTVVASGGASGNPITFTGTAGVCTVGAPTTATSATVSFVAAGACALTANQAGSTYYLAAGSVMQTFSVAKSGQTISFTTSAPANATVDGPTYTPAATSTSGSPVVLTIDAATSTVCAMDGAGVVSFTAAGTCTIDASVAATANYTAATSSQSFTVAPGTVSNGSALCFVQAGASGCSPASVAIGSKGSFTGSVRLLDRSGNAVASNVALTVTLAVTKANHLGSPTPASVTIPAGASESDSFTIGFTDNGAQDDGVLTATASGLTVSMTLTVK